MNRLPMLLALLGLIACLVLAVPQIAPSQGLIPGGHGNWGNWPPGHHTPSIPNIPHIPIGPSDHHDTHFDWPNININPHPIIPSRPTPSPNIYYPTPSHNALPSQPEPQVDPLPNEVVVQVEPNNFMDKLNIKKLTKEELDAFKDQIQDKTGELGQQLDSILGKDGAAQSLTDLASQGKLDAAAVKDFIGKADGLSLPDQLKATEVLKGIIFNNGAINAINIANLNLNINFAPVINIVNVNVVNIGGGGIWPGFWGFPWWPWAGPAWLGPGMWWGRCPYCPAPYYYPNANGADANALPYSLADPIPSYEGQVVRSGILITNGGTDTVNYVIDRKQFSMPPDYRQTIPRTKVAISFDRGGNFGNARYQIADDWYEFTPTDRGWELYRQSANVTLDNAGNPFEFRCVLDNRRQTVAAGSQSRHTGKYPMLLRFDNGQGQTQQKMLTKRTYQVAIGKDGLLDVFRPDDVTMPAPMADLAKKQQEETKNLFATPEKIPSLFGPSPQEPSSAEPKDEAPKLPNLFGPAES